MTRSGPPSLIRDQDYETIEAAVMETARGRWFLSEFARRNRTADTEMLLDAIRKLQTAVTEQEGEDTFGRIRKDLMEMSAAIAQTRREISAMHPEATDGSRIIEATEELDAIVESTEKATSEILNAAEQVQEIAWTLREQGAGDGPCDRLDGLTTSVYMACSFQDLTGQRTGKVVKVLRFIENRINSMVDIWGLDDIEVKPISEHSDPRPDAHLLNGPQLEGRGSSQDEVDTMMTEADFDPDDIVFAETEEITPENLNKVSFDAIEVTTPADEPAPEPDEIVARAEPASVETADIAAELPEIGDMPEPPAIETAGETAGEAVGETAGKAGSAVPAQAPIDADAELSGSIMDELRTLSDEIGVRSLDDLEAMDTSFAPAPVNRITEPDMPAGTGADTGTQALGIAADMNPADDFSAEAAAAAEPMAAADEIGEEPAALDMAGDDGDSDEDIYSRLAADLQSIMNTHESRSAAAPDLDGRSADAVAGQETSEGGAQSSGATALSNLSNLSQAHRMALFS